MRHVRVYPIRNFDKLQKEALSLIPTSTAKVYGDYNYLPDIDQNDPSSSWAYGLNSKPSTKPYCDVTMLMIHKACGAYIRSWGCTSWEVKSLWYHVYNEGGTYQWHCHTSTNMTGVIQLLLEDERDYTKLMGFEEKIKEGDIVLFPSMHPHKSEVVHGSKIIIGFNWDMHSDMQKPEQASPW